MNNLCTRLLSLGALLALCVGCNHSDSSPKSGSATSQMKPAQAAAPITLDLIVGGPFAFAQRNDSLIIWIPNVKDHPKPFGVGLTDIPHLGDRPREFEQGDYDFTKGIRPSAASNVLVPVQAASILSWSVKKYNLSATPKKKPYLTIKLPIPREIIPWNADPMTVSDTATGSNAATTPRLSTMAILRYEFQDGDAPEMTATGQPTWKATPIPNGTERILFLAVNPPDPKPGEDEHVHARAAFSELAKMVGVKQTIDFPSVTYTRNQPLVPGVLSNDLSEILGAGADATAPAGTLKAQFGILVEIFGKINDCKASNVLVTQ
jgi:hypothetical protein